MGCSEVNVAYEEDALKKCEKNNEINQQNNDINNEDNNDKDNNRIYNKTKDKENKVEQINEDDEQPEFKKPPTCKSKFHEKGLNILNDSEEIKLDDSY